MDGQVNLDLYPHWTDSTLTSEGVGPYSLSVRQAGSQVPLQNVINQNVADAFPTELNPWSKMTIGTQGIQPGFLTVSNPVGGCDNVTGQQVTVAIPIMSPLQADIYNQAVPGSLQEGDVAQLVHTAPFDTVATHHVTDPATVKQQPFISKLFAGPAIEEIQYGGFPWKGVDKDGNPVDFPVLFNPDGTVKYDPVVQKPQIGVKFNKGQFFVPKDTNELNLVTHGGPGSAYGQGKNILLIPGAPPTLPMVITVGAGGSVDVGARFLAYSRTVPDPLGTLKDTDLSPLSYANTITGQQSIGYSIPPATDVTRATGYKIWSTIVGDPTGDFYLADTKSGIDPTTTVTGTLSAADASLTTLFVGTQTTINVDNSIELTGVARVDGGVQTITLTHSPPVDADIPWPTSYGPIRDGLTAICTNDDSIWWRSSGTWHTDVDTGGGGGGGGGAGSGAANYGLSTRWHDEEGSGTVWGGSDNYVPWDLFANGANVYLDSSHPDGLTIPADGGGDYWIYTNLWVDLRDAPAAADYSVEYELNIEHWRGATRLLTIGKQDLYEQTSTDQFWSDPNFDVGAVVTGTQPGDVIKILINMQFTNMSQAYLSAGNTLGDIREASWISIAPVGVAAAASGPVAMSTSLNLNTIPGSASLAGRATLGWSGPLQVDHGGWATAGTNGTTGIIVIPVTGPYEVSALLQLDTGFNTLTYGESMRVEVRINGTPPNNFMIYDMTNLHNPTIPFLDFIDFTVGDQVEIRLYDENITTNPHLDIQSGYLNLSLIN